VPLAPNLHEGDGAVESHNLDIASHYVNGEKPKRDSNRALNSARFLVGLLGVASLIVGLRAAWRSDSPTAALGVGFALLVVALIANRDLAEFSGRWKDAGFTIKRAAGGTLDALAEKLLDAVQASNREVGDADPKAQLATLQGEIEEVASLARREADEMRWGDPEGWATAVAGQIRTGLVKLREDRPYVQYDYVPRSEELGLGPQIPCNLRWWGDWLIICRVIDPNGNIVKMPVTGQRYMMGNNFSVTYPRSFKDAPDLVPGEYTFEWIRAMVGYTPSRRAKKSQWVEGAVLARDVVVITSDMLDARKYVDFEIRREEVESEQKQLGHLPPPTL
jgi:hypothetical protein